MCGVAVLNPHDVLRDGFNFNRMPLISPSPSTSSNSRDSNPNPETVLNSNRRKRNPQNSNFGNNVLRRSTTSAKIGHGPNLVMGKVTILKRGEALDNEENAEKKTEKTTLLFDKELKTVKKKKKNKKRVSFDKENKLNKYEKKTELFDKQIKSDKKSELFDEQNKYGKKKPDIVREIEDSESIEVVLTRLGPDPVMLPRFYAGSVFVDSPSPSSVPFPSFLAGETYDEDASSDLRKLLKIREFEIVRAG